MERPTIVLTLALVLVTGTASAVIWQQQNRIGELMALNATSGSESAKLKKQLLANSVPPAEAVAPEASSVDEPKPTSTESGADSPDPRQGGRNGFRQRGAERFADLLADPEISSLMLSQRKASLDSRYAALFKKLGLSPAETEELKKLLAERQLSRIETGVVARAEGAGPEDRDAVRDLMKQSDSESDAQLQALLGPDRYNTLNDYEKTATVRTQVDQFAQRLSYSATPLQGYQSEAMVQLLAAMPPPEFPRRSPTPEQTAAYLQDLQKYNAEVYLRSSSILSPDQLNALQQVQQEATDRAKLGTLMRRRSGGGG